MTPFGTVGIVALNGIMVGIRQAGVAAIGTRQEVQIQSGAHRLATQKGFTMAHAIAVAAHCQRLRQVL
jgi:hypothetical protein